MLLVCGVFAGSVVLEIALIGRVMPRGIFGSSPNRRRTLRAIWRHFLLHCLQNKRNPAAVAEQDFMSNRRAFSKRDLKGETRALARAGVNIVTTYCFLQ